MCAKQVLSAGAGCYRCQIDRDSEKYATVPKHAPLADSGRAIQDTGVEQRGHGVRVPRRQLADGPAVSVVDRDAVWILGRRDSPECDRCTELCPQRRDLVIGGNDQTQNRFGISAADGVQAAGR